MGVPSFTLRTVASLPAASAPSATTYDVPTVTAWFRPLGAYVTLQTEAPVEALKASMLPPGSLVSNRQPMDPTITRPLVMDSDLAMKYGLSFFRQIRLPVAGLYLLSLSLVIAYRRPPNGNG